MMQPFVSVIVPIYNVETYLKGCLDSLLNQTDGNFEAILVDDGSTDLSGSIADDYAKKDKRFKVIHQSNKGLSGARNAGLKVAKGKYVFFLDSDDYVHPDFLNLMGQVAQNEDADMVVCKLQHTDKFYHKIESGLKLSKIKIKRYDRPMDAYLTQRELPSNVCVKLHKRSVLKEMSFKEGIYFEDALFTTIEMTKVKSLVFLDAPLYYYYSNPQSIMRSSFTLEKVESYVTVIREIYAYIKEYEPAYLSKVKREVLNKRVKMCMNQAIRKQRSVYQSQMLFVAMAEKFAALYREGCISMDGLKVHQKMALALLIHNNPKGAYVIMKYL